MEHRRAVVIVCLAAVCLCTSLSCKSSTSQELDGAKVVRAFQGAVASAAEKVKPSVVFVEASTRAGADETETGRRTYRSATISVTGLAVADGGFLLVPLALKPENIERIRVWIDETEYEANLRDSDEKTGVGLLQVQDPPQLVSAVFGDSRQVQVGDFIVGVNASGKEQAFEKFLEFASVKGKVQTALLDELRTTVSYPPGGTVFVNMNGEIVAMSLGNRISLTNEIREELGRMLARAGKEDPNLITEKKKPWLGVTYAKLGDEYADAVGLPKESVLIQRVYRDSPAAQAGLQTHDLVTAVDGRKITKKGPQALGEFEKMLKPEVDREIKFSILRGGATLELAAKFQEEPKPREFRAEKIGIIVTEITDIQWYEKALDTREGVLVKQVIPGSPAATSKQFGEKTITEGNVIVKLGNVPTPNMDKFIEAVRALEKDAASVVLVTLARERHYAHEVINLQIGGRGKK
ncbi:MAG: PDZ domain-containing protein [Planctomycetota bacterium]|nr:PDZ domain-containing protein [Planctomycetota bacterium]